MTVHNKSDVKSDPWIGFTKSESFRAYMFASEDAYIITQHTDGLALLHNIEIDTSKGSIYILTFDCSLKGFWDIGNICNYQFQITILKMVYKIALSIFVIFVFSTFSVQNRSTLIDRLAPINYIAIRHTFRRQVATLSACESCFFFTSSQRKSVAQSARNYMFERVKK